MRRETERDFLKTVESLFLWLAFEAICNWPLPSFPPNLSPCSHQHH